MRDARKYLNASMIIPFFSRARYKRDAKRFRNSVAAVRRGDFTSIEKLVRAIRSDTHEEIAETQSHSSALARLERARLALREEAVWGFEQFLREQRNRRNQEDRPENNWSLAFPFSVFWSRLSARLNPQSRSGLARLSEQISPGVGYLSSGWLAPIGVGVTFTIAMVTLFTNPAEVAKAGTSPTAVIRPASEAVPGGQPAPAVSSGRDPTNSGPARGVSAAVTLPNATGNSGGAKLDPAIKVEPRKIVIRRHYEAQVGEYDFSSDHTTTISCNPGIPEKLCDTYDVHPPTGE